MHGVQRLAVLVRPPFKLPLLNRQGLPILGLRISRTRTYPKIAMMPRLYVGVRQRRFEVVFGNVGKLLPAGGLRLGNAEVGEGLLLRGNAL